MSAELRPLLAATIAVYLVAVFALSFVARRRIHSAEDFIVAGRRLPLSLAWATLLATWFGAGTLLTAADEVRREGLERAALDPFGAGLCLILAGLVFARPLWRMGLLTVADFFRLRFGPRAELVSALIVVPSYFGWIAAQFVALAAMLELLFNLPMVWGVLVVAVVGTAYTWLGGMWSVTLTDAFQVVLVLAGLVVLTINVLDALGQGNAAAGWLRFVHETPREYLRPWPRGSTVEFVGWLSVLLVGALGNVPGQDLLQRVFASRSARVAQQACLLAGGAYILFGLAPMFLALSSRILIPGASDQAILPAMSALFFTPAMLIVFSLALMSAVLSTIDSALLSPATVIAQNILPRSAPCARLPSLVLNRIAVLIVAAASLVLAYWGKSAYELLESAYELPLVGLFVPLALGLRRPPRRQSAGLAAMVAGTGAWLGHSVLGWATFLPHLWGATVPMALGSAMVSLAAYLIAEFLPGRTRE